MAKLQTERLGRLTITSCREAPRPTDVLDQFSRPAAVVKKGRGNIEILELGETRLVCRKYIHGGLLRGITGHLFLTERRATEELRIHIYLEESCFPVVPPYGYVATNRFLARSLYYLTFFEDNAVDLLEFLVQAGKKERLRAIRRFADLLVRLGTLGVYLPDLHLRNVIRTRTGGLLFLDFDKACRKPVARQDMERMLWRLDRFAEKKERSGELVVSRLEKALFLRIFERSSGYTGMATAMEVRLEGKRRRQRMGWLVESLFYGKQDKSTVPKGIQRNGGANG